MSSALAGWDTSYDDRGLGGFLSRIFHIGKIFGTSKRDNLRAKIEEIIVLLETQRNKLEETLHKLKRRDEELFQKAVEAYSKKDIARAKIYAGEVAEIRKIAESVKMTALALEKIKLRLETIMDMSGVATVLAPLLPVLQGLKEQVRGVMPEVSMQLDLIVEKMNEIIIEAGTTSERSLEVLTVSSDTQKILEEARAVAELKIKNEFPSLPNDLLQQTQPEQAQEEKSKEPVPVPAALQQQAAQRKVVVKTITMSELEEMVLDYIKRHNGFLDVNECAKACGVSKDYVLKALDRLRKKGRIRLA